MTKKVLIATDGSKLASKGVKQSLEIAKKLGVPAIIMTATEDWAIGDMARDAENYIPNSIEMFEKAAAETADAILTKAEKEAKKQGVKCERLHVKDRHPAEAILETVDKKKADLVVMASHGLRGVKKLLLGSVTSEVLGHSKVPVLVVR